MIGCGKLSKTHYEVRGRYRTMCPVCFNLLTHPHSPPNPPTPTHAHLLVYVEEKLERLRRKLGRVGEAVALVDKGARERRTQAGPSLDTLSYSLHTF